MLALLLATLVGYLCIGSLCFSALESETEQQRWEEGKARVGSPAKFFHAVFRLRTDFLTAISDLNLDS